MEGMSLGATFFECLFPDLSVLFCLSEGENVGVLILRLAGVGERDEGPKESNSENAMSGFWKCVSDCDRSASEWSCSVPLCPSMSTSDWPQEGQDSLGGGP
mmetsp:Transcript_145355/g.465741  ORF Transcript_145355/g.465741 Transcript_145355/m.465741 type:complete len:101 (+) Transcript_145355:1897-2199(+)